MSYQKPRAIGAGSTIALISPASVVKPELVERGAAALEKLGFKTRVMPHALARGPLNYAGPWQDRLADLHAAYADPDVDAIMCTRGGWGCAELLPHLDSQLIWANNKALLGYSDVTSLHVWLHRQLQRVTFQAPMAASDFAKEGDWGPDMATWTAALEGAESWSIGPESGLKILRPGRAEGVLSGGCMSIYAESLGTEFAPEDRGGVLFLEDVGTHPYQWNRMLRHLDFAGLLRGVTGIVFGDMRQCCPPEDDAVMEETLLYALRDFDGPIAIGLRSGHVVGGNLTLPFGVKVRLAFEDETNPRVDFVEAAVTV